MRQSIYLFFSATLLLLLMTQCQETTAVKAEVKEIPAKVEEKVVAKPVSTEVAQPEKLAAPKVAEATVPQAEKPAKPTSKKVVAKAEKPIARKEQPKPVKKKRAEIKFAETLHKFGTIKSGDKVKHKFKFKNTGDANLVIKNVEVSCGCTFPSYPFLPIEPGDEGAIEVTFDSKGKVGRQKPTVTVVTNARPRTLKLNLEGFVE